LYVDGLYIKDLPEAPPIITGDIAWYAPHERVGYKDIRIWNQALSLSFLQQAVKEFDGYYYPALVYYQPARLHKDYDLYTRRYKNSISTIEYLNYRYSY
jgi:hypothetical protein